MIYVKPCFKLKTDPAVTGSLGDEIKLFKNGDEVGTALGANELSNEICLEDTSEGDVFEFRNGGKDNVSLSLAYEYEYTIYSI